MINIITAAPSRSIFSRAVQLTAWYPLAHHRRWQTGILMRWKLVGCRYSQHRREHSRSQAHRTHRGTLSLPCRHCESQQRGWCSHKYEHLKMQISQGSRHWQESRSRKNLEKKLFIFFSLELENCIFISLSLLDFQDFETKILLLFSICEIFKTILFLFKIVKTKFSFYSWFMRFCSLFLFLFLWEMLHIWERNMYFSRFEMWWQNVMVWDFGGDLVSEKDHC